MHYTVKLLGTLISFLNPMLAEYFELPLPHPLVSCSSPLTLPRLSKEVYD